MRFNIPEEILDICEKLQKAGFEAYLVGGCVRDLLMDKEPKDWDITTNAKPQEIQKIFPDSVYENKFGTVAVKTQSENERLKIVEITTFRLEGKYTDKRHPDEIKFAKTVEEDLSRRDFTCNAIALQCDANLRMHANCKLIDIFNGQKDIKNKIIRTVGKPEERFNEDALRLMRAIRFSVQLGFEIEEKTFKAIKKEAGLIEMIAKERIRDEFIKIIMTPLAKRGVELLEETSLLKYIVPELREGIDNGQNKHHIYTIWEHNLRALDYAAKKNYSLEIRLASLLHDVGKPRTKAGEGPDCTFYNHEVVGAKITAKIMDNLRFPNNIAEKVIHLVRYHLFYYNVGEVTASGVRRFLARVGAENIDDLIKVREADRIGSGVPKALPYKLRHLLFMIEKVKRDPISPKMLKINGDSIMEILKIKPGHKIGWILSILLDEVIEKPEKNDKKKLEIRVEKLWKLSDVELEKMAKAARERKNEFESGIEEEIKSKFYVK
ncbi:MAG: HD domain-containing protein [Patescibacteria group bacterium]|nr:HD domain-containing protein [Patescibacteria group bacterium]